MLPKNWQIIFLQFQAVWLVVAIAAQVFFFPPFSLVSVALVVAGAGILLVGFKITELLLGVFTGVRKLSPVSMLVIFLAKLVWWGALFAGATHIKSDLERYPLALGFGSFLASMVTLVALQYGAPKQDENPKSPS